jgi:hypothetical protein
MNNPKKVFLAITKKIIFHPILSIVKACGQNLKIIAFFSIQSFLFQPSSTGIESILIATPKMGYVHVQNTL